MGALAQGSGIPKLRMLPSAASVAEARAGTEASLEPQVHCHLIPNPGTSLRKTSEWVKGFKLEAIGLWEFSGL